jgi:penicillin-binding protein 2
MWRRRKKYRDFELAPDEIFLDSSNQPDFNTNQLEGRLEKPLPRASYYGIGIAVVLVFLTLTAQAANLEIVKGAQYALQSERNRLRPQVVFAERGAILDRNGVPLVSNKEEADGTVTRVYESPGFAHLLGYVSYPKKDSSGNYYDTDITGLAGVEAAFNDTLAGKNGTLLTEEDARGHVQSQGTVQPAVNGKPVTLSIDARAQRAFYNSIKELADKTPFQGGAAVLMDITTGEVHALVSYPEYDPNILSAGQPADVIASYATNSRQPYLDRAISGLYTPGSIVKPIEASGALTDKIISPDKVIYTNGSISVPNPYDPAHPSIFRDWKNLGPLDIRHAVAWSSDVFFYTIGGGFGDQKGLGISRLEYWYKTFGYTSKTGIELSNEASGIIPSPEWKKKTFDDDWRLGDTYHTAIGQYGTQITLLEAARSIGAVANGGKLMKPTILKGTEPSGASIPVDPGALQIVREGMRLGATEGTSVGLNDLSFVQLAGKTGTAQLGVHNEYYNMWAVGFWPYNNPKYVYVVLMDHGPAGTAVGAVYVTHQALQALHQTAPEYFK